jgi:hypothetical protein
MTVSIAPEKIAQIRNLLKTWSVKTHATRHELQKVLGKLLYISRCCHPARLFVGRMLETLRSAPIKGKIPLQNSFKRDINWFVRFLLAYNAIHLIDPPATTYHINICVYISDNIAVINCNNCKYIVNIDLQYKNPTVHAQTLWVILIFMRLWTTVWIENNIVVHTSSPTVLKISNTGSSKDNIEMTLARNIWLVSAICKANIRANVSQQQLSIDNCKIIKQELVKTVNNVYSDI